MRIKALTLIAFLTAAPLSVYSQESAANQTENEPPLLSELLRDNPQTSIFYSALESTGLADTLSKYLDPTYPGDYDISYKGRIILYTSSSSEQRVYPQKRVFKFTMFVVPDSILKADHNINSLAELKAYAQSKYPQGAALPDNDRESSLNQFLSYHILPVGLEWDQLNISAPDYIKNRSYLDELDVEDFYETLLPHSIMRISTPYKQPSYANAQDITEQEKYGIFINRKGTLKNPESLIAGTQINRVAESDPSSLNGTYYYISEPLVYNEATRNALDVRMRVMARTISPDFINCDPQSIIKTSSFLLYFAPGYTTNIRNMTGLSPTSSFFIGYKYPYYNEYYGDRIFLENNYDIIIKLPPVPKSGLYEVRVNGYFTNYSYEDEGKGHVLFFTGSDPDRLSPCGSPRKLGVNVNDISDDNQVLRKNGYMKMADSYFKSVVQNNRLFRMIVNEQYMDCNEDHYLRIRQMDADAFISYPLNYIEIVPFSVYSGENGPEDSH